MNMASLAVRVILIAAIVLIGGALLTFFDVKTLGIGIALVLAAAAGLMKNNS